MTFCRDSATPVAAEEGLTGSLSTERVDSVKCYGQWKEFSQEEVPFNRRVDTDRKVIFFCARFIYANYVSQALVAYICTA